MSDINRYINSLKLTSKYSKFKISSEIHNIYSNQELSDNISDMSIIEIIEEIAKYCESFKLSDEDFFEYLLEMYSKDINWVIKVLYILKNNSEYEEFLDKYPYFKFLVNNMPGSTYEAFISENNRDEKFIKYESFISTSDTIEVINDFIAIINNKLYVVDVKDLMLRYPEFNYVNNDSYKNFFVDGVFAVPVNITDIIISDEKNVSKYLHQISTLIIGDGLSSKTRLFNKCSNCSSLVVFSDNDNIHSLSKYPNIKTVSLFGNLTTSSCNYLRDSYVETIEFTDNIKDIRDVYIRSCHHLKTVILP